VKARLDHLLLGAIALLAGALVWVVSGTLTTPVVNAGDKAPDFKITTDAGKPVTRANFGGKLLVLNFWASWCEPCVAEAPSLEALSKTLGAQGLVVLGVSLDTNEKRYHDFVRRFGLTYELTRDPQANISASYGTFQIPETYIIDGSGRVVEKIISNQDFMDPNFVSRLKSLL